ncbi:uncharacterized protein MELLADRAFT_107505 [Melampsora larici-populina 98AG31]|uniref:F-box domain-containing protein n=1 Tax=Melampsora larici-populina (strain 98AG31 / pathotype 3-4-7) TaxID=747676 RepID=F4RQ11_MELLP|nr:uncharacterized protein MELLADRAFT_107505 [Melampsora larici-populina 98AG31]EGG05636.1 hypothetical protein MELLADRAFT_107505 [Melampsora larici-populina 98AG31]
MSCGRSASSRYFPDEVLEVLFDHILDFHSKSDPENHLFLQFRLVCQRWSYLILSKYLRTIIIHSPHQLENLLNNWANLSASSPDSSLTFSPVRRLEIGSIYHRKTLESCRFLGLYSPKTTVFGDLSNPNPEFHLGYLLRVLYKFRYRKPYYPSVCTVYGVIQLIKLLGENIKCLHLTFSDSFGFPQPLITSISNLSLLRSLSISHAQDPAFGRSEEGKSYEPNTLIDLLKSLTRLETLELGCGKGLPDFTDSNLRLPNLIQLKIVHQSKTSEIGILSFCKLIQNQIKVFEFSSLRGSEDHPKYFKKMLKCFQNQVEFIRIDSENFEFDLNDLISNLEFPKLKFYDPRLPLRTSDWSNLDKFKISLSNLLESEIVQELNTLVIGPYSDFMIDTPYGFAYHLKSLFKAWGLIKKKSGRLSRDLNRRENGPCRIPRNLKTIIFHKHHALGNTSIELILEDFREIGIELNCLTFHLESWKWFELVYCKLYWKGRAFRKVCLA